MGELFSSLGIEWGKIIAQTVNFGILAFVLFKLVYKPILKVLEEREASAKKALENSSSIEEKLKEAEEASKKILSDARVASQKIIKETEKSASNLKDKLSAEAKAEAEKILLSAEKKMDEERNKFYSTLKKELGEIVTLGIEKTIGKYADTSLQKKMSEDALKEAIVISEKFEHSKK